MGELSKHQLNLILNTLEPENKQLRQKLEAAEARVVDLEEVIASYQHLAASDMRKINELEAAIREAREQKPYAYEHFASDAYSCLAYGDDTDNVFNDSTMSYINNQMLKVEVKPLFERPVPAMPIQDDKWVTITNEEWNIPKIGQRVIVCIDGVVQNVPVKIDCTDPDIGCCKYYWDHKDFDESPFVKAGDSWMPWPTKPQSEVKPSC